MIVNGNYLKHPEQVSGVLDEFLHTRGIKIDRENESNNIITGIHYMNVLQKIKEKTDLKSEHQKDLEYLQLLFPLYGLKDILKKVHKSEEVTDKELETVAAFVDAFCTVSLHSAIVGPIVAAIAQKCNQHSHTKTCRKYQTTCRFNMPKLPSNKTIIARPYKEDENNLKAKHAEVIKKVKEVLKDKEAISVGLKTVI